MVKTQEKPQVELDERIICLLAGESGSGKTFFIANLKDAIIYDSDLGGGSAYLKARIERNGSEREEVTSYFDVLNDIKKRVAEKRLKKNVVIDHATNLHQDAILRYNPSGEADFGRAGNRGTQDWRRIRALVKTLDCNLFVVAHTKGEWVEQKEVGKTADAAKNIEGDMQIVLYLKRPGGPGSKMQPTTEVPSTAQVVKWRRDPEDPRGMVPLTFPFTMQTFLSIAGKGMERELKNVELATAEMVDAAKKCVTDNKIDEEVLAKWFKKIGASDFDTASKEQVQKFIEYYKTKSTIPA